VTRVANRSGLLLVLTLPVNVKWRGAVGDTGTEGRLADVWIVART
jgi:hypothetical protein